MGITNLNLDRQINMSECEDHKRLLKAEAMTSGNEQKQDDDQGRRPGVRRTTKDGAPTIKQERKCGEGGSRGGKRYR